MLRVLQVIGKKDRAGSILKEMQTYKRVDLQQKVINAKFDVSYVAKELQDFYLEYEEK